MVGCFIKICIFLVFITQISGDESYFKTLVSEGIPQNWYDDFDPSPFIKVGMKYYLVSNETVSWFKAAHICRQYNSHLASIKNDHDKDELHAYLNNNWIGRWFWLSGISLSPLHTPIWLGTELNVHLDERTSERSANCVDIRYKNRKWILCNKNCKNLAYFICEKNPPMTISFTTW